MSDPLPIAAEVLYPHLQQVFGAGVRLSGWTNLAGGARKQVFRLHLAQPDLEVVLLVWQNKADYFGERDNSDSIRSDRQAPFLYRANSALLQQKGLRVPELYFFDGTFSEVPFCFALVEFLNARTFNEWRVDRSPQEIPPLLGKVRDYLYAMHTIRRDTYGTALDRTEKQVTCQARTLQETQADLEGLAQDFAGVNAAEASVREKLEILYRRIQPRHSYAFIHDELGPDEHLLIDEYDEIAIIDLDGCHFFDLEREHAYLKLRFDSLYEYLRRDDLDPARMQFYGLCLHISAAYGHYRLFKQGFPDPEILKAIYELNIRKFLNFSIA